MTKEEIEKLFDEGVKSCLPKILVKDGAETNKHKTEIVQIGFQSGTDWLRESWVEMYLALSIAEEQLLADCSYKEQEICDKALTKANKTLGVSDE